MKKFKDPKWDTFSKCYEEMLKYRLTRRLLEHTHIPWFWGESDTDSESGGRSPTPAGKNRNQEDQEVSVNRAEGELEECKQRETSIAVPRLVLSRDENISKGIVAGVAEVAENEQERRCDEGGRAKVSSTLQEKQTQVTTDKKLQLTSKPSRSRRVQPLPTQAIKEDVKQNRHPFILYASGEKDSDIARRKTHNVRPAASTKEIHESALRAKTRREVERQLQSQRAERRRSKSADVDKARLRAVAPEFNPWLTEYMRCFSARSR
uniref:Centriole, cilia and spindle-associated protein n=1 Tax=Knipowitschia caucasica TaxID=637954 RepID=A0AAV2LND7_KNICA